MSQRSKDQVMARQRQMMEMMKEAKRLSMLSADQLSSDSIIDSEPARSFLQRTFSMSIIDTNRRTNLPRTAASVDFAAGRAQDDLTVGYKTTASSSGRGWSSKYSVAVQKELVDLDGRHITVERLLLRTRQLPGENVENRQEMDFPVRWVLNGCIDRCMICMQLFTTLRRRHHCRSCGQLVCAQCSQIRVIIAELSLTQRHRACKKCYRGFNNTIHLTAPVRAPPFAILQSTNNDDVECPSLVMCDVEDQMGIRVVEESATAHYVLRICSTKRKIGATSSPDYNSAGLDDASPVVAYRRVPLEQEHAFFNICTHPSILFNPRLDNYLAESGNNCEPSSKLSQPVIYFAAQQQRQDIEESEKILRDEQHLTIFDVVISPAMIERLHLRPVQLMLVSQLLSFWNLLLRTDFGAEDVFFQFIDVAGRYLTPYNTEYVAASFSNDSSTTAAGEIAKVYLPRRIQVLEKWGHLLLIPAQYLETVADIIHDASVAASHSTDVDDDVGEKHMKAMRLDMSRSDLAMSSLVSSSQLRAHLVCAAAAPHSLLYSGSRLLKQFADDTQYLHALKLIRQMQRVDADAASPDEDVINEKTASPVTSAERSARRRTMGALLMQRLGMPSAEAFDSDDDDFVPPAAKSNSNITGREVVAAMKHAVMEEQHLNFEDLPSHGSGISSVKSDVTASTIAPLPSEQPDVVAGRKKNTWRSMVSTAKLSVDRLTAVQRKATDVQQQRKHSISSQASGLSITNRSMTTTTKKLPAKERYAQQQASGHQLIEASMMRIEMLRNISGIASQEMKAQSLKDPYVLLGWQIQLCVPIPHNPSVSRSNAAVNPSSLHINDSNDAVIHTQSRSSGNGSEEDFQIRIAVITGVRLSDDTNNKVSDGTRAPPKQKRQALHFFAAKKEKRIETAADATNGTGVIQPAEFRVSSTAYADTWLKLNRFPHNSTPLLMDGHTPPAQRSAVNAAAEDGLNFKVMRRVFNVKVKKRRGLGRTTKMHILKKAS